VTRRRRAPAHAGDVRALAFDPGYAQLGWAAVDVCTACPGVDPLALGLVVTRPDREPGWVETSGTKGETARASERRRVEELATQVHLLVDRFAPRVLLAEGYSPVRDSAVTGRMAMTWTVLFAEALHRGIPFVDVSPMGLKLALCGAKTATKHDVAEALYQRHHVGDLRALLDAGGVQWGKREHPFDALAAAHVLAGEVRASLGL